MEGYGKRVLVVEDDDHLRDLLVVMFTQVGYNVHVARNGGEALLEMTRRHFHAVVTDNQMSPISGLEFLAMSGFGWPDTPVVMLSGDGPATAEQAGRLGAYACLQKPYDCHRLLEVVRTAIQQPPAIHERLMTSHMPNQGPGRPSAKRLTTKGT